MRTIHLLVSTTLVAAPFVSPAQQPTASPASRAVVDSFLVFARGARSQATPAPVATTTGAFFALSVGDLAASVRWYREKLGLSVVMEAPKTGGGQATVLEGGGLIVELVAQDEAQPLSRVAPTVRGNLYIHGIFKAGVIVDDYEKTLATIRERQIPIAIGPFPARDGQRANFIIRDNAGNYIQFFSKK
jgi:catechol 2,3-dioxygenase-like lactoylglutathione lyase family enzyme